jgi:hypothetical protein
MNGSQRARNLANTVYGRDAVQLDEYLAFDDTKCRNVCSRSIAQGCRDAVIVRVDPDGNKQWRLASTGCIDLRSCACLRQFEI